MGTVKEKYDKEKDPEGVWKIFQDFDADGSNSIDLDELTTMVKALGMVLTKGEVKKYMDEADTDKSGEIDFDEFYSVVQAASVQGATTSSGESFAKLIQRKKNSKDMLWRTDRVGTGVKVEDKDRLASFDSTTGYGACLLSEWIPGSDKVTRGLVIMEVEAKGPVWVGIVGRNFNPEGEWWQQAFFSDDPSVAKNERLPQITAMRFPDGKVYSNGQEDSNSKGPTIGADGKFTIQLDIHKDLDSVDFNVFQGDSDAAKIQLAGLKPEIGVAVCFGPVPEGQKSEIRVVGSSCEIAQKRNRRSSRDLWDDDNSVGVNDKNTGAVGSAELNG